MKKFLILLIAALALLGCAGNKAIGQKAAVANENPWCEKLAETDAFFKNMLIDIMVNGSESLGEGNVTIGYCHCITITTCDGVDYCSVEQCPTHKTYFLDERAIETN